MEKQKLMMMMVYWVLSEFGFRGVYNYSFKALTRGQDTRDAGFNIIYEGTFENVGPDPARYIILLTQVGKSNPASRLLVMNYGVCQ